MNYEERIREASEGQKVIQNNTGTFTEFFIFFTEFFIFFTEFFYIFYRIFYIFYRIFFVFTAIIFFDRNILNLCRTCFSDLITAEKKGLTEKCDVIQVRSLNICVCTYDI